MPRKKFEETPYDPIAASILTGISGNTALQEPTQETVGGPAPELPKMTVVAEPEPEAQVVESVVEAVPEPKESAQEVASPTPAVETKRKADTKPVRFDMPREEKEEWDAFILRLSQRSDSTVGTSTLCRVLMSLAIHAEDQINAQIDKTTFKTPCNRDKFELAEFESKWMVAMSGGLRKSTPYQLPQ